MVQVVIDSNVLLECQQLQDLPWNKMFPEEPEVSIVLTKMVIIEIDRHKRSARKRLQKRARLAGKIFDQLVESDEPVVLRDQAPKLTIKVAAGTGREVQEAGLDLDVPDHLILLQAIAFRNTAPSQPVFLLTDDSNLRLTAKSHGFPCKAIPDDWFLPDEPDETEIENKQLRSEVDALRNAAPKIEIGLKLEDGATVVRAVRYEPLSSTVVQDLVSAVEARYPMKDFGDGTPIPSIGRGITLFQALESTSLLNELTKHFSTPDPAEVARYRDDLYPKWLKSLEEYFCQLHEQLEILERIISFDAELVNRGACPAEVVAVTFAAQARLKLFRRTQRPIQLAKMPSPPVAPKGKLARPSWLGGFPLGSDYLPGRAYDQNFERLAMNLSSQQSSDQFSWSSSDDEKPRQQLKRSCGLWRHLGPSERVRFHGLLAPLQDVGEPFNVALTCRIEAKNLIRPIERTLGVRVEITEGDTEARAYELVEAGFDSLVEEADDNTEDANG